jgi:uncharacterized protein (DUF1015 family)
MPLISPFRALCYAPRLRRDLDHLVAPPYDVISEERRARLASRHENNIVHLDLPRAEPFPRGPEPDDAYMQAARLLGSWIREGVLTRDARPAFYACEQRYRTASGEEFRRRGFFARLRLDRFETGTVIPHEKTLDRPRADRRRLLAATRTHLSAVFLLHPDPGGEVAAMMEQAQAGEVFEEAADDEGVVSRVVRLDDEPRIARLVRRLGEHWSLMADGHHRYESALAYDDECRAAGREGAQHILAFFCSLEDPGLAILPIHRVVHSLPEFDPARFRGRLEQAFDLKRVEGPEALRTSLRSRTPRPGVFGITLRGETGFWMAEWKDGAGLDRPEMAPIPQPLRRLDVILLHHLVFEGILGITPEVQARQTNLDYVKDERDVLTRVREGRAEIGILMNPTRIEQVVEVTRSGLRLPQKSTYFHPKVTTGLVLDPLDP